ncbi:MAG: hypothetical protein IKP95_12945 [Ruminococcus sp.]|nr:hypothetical protein [Ruminococcus sp.]
MRLAPSDYTRKLYNTENPDLRVCRKLTENPDLRVCRKLTDEQSEPLVCSKKSGSNTVVVVKADHTCRSFQRGGERGHFG